jgi:hypothetical protein
MNKKIILNSHQDIDSPLRTKHLLKWQAQAEWLRRGIMCIKGRANTLTGDASLFSFVSLSLLYYNVYALLSMLDYW